MVYLCQLLWSKKGTVGNQTGAEGKILFGGSVADCANVGAVEVPLAERGLIR